MATLVSSFFSPAHPTERIKTNKPIDIGPPAIYKIPLHTVMKNEKQKLAKFEFGSPSRTQKPNKVIMVVGATGAGKSTLINGMINYLFGVKWGDDFRYKLITDEGKQSQAVSQTEWISAYTFHWWNSSPLPYTLTIIDTPGFGDTRGLERDQKITKQIKDFFSAAGKEGIDQLHGIGFVTQASLARLTPTQKYIFDAILSVFGKDVKKNIFIMTTFADGADPPVMDAIKAADIPHENCFPFNNSALFTKGKNKFTKMFWEMGYESFNDFFMEFGNKPAVSLQLTQEVLQERQHLETVVGGLQPQIDNGLGKIDQMRQQEKMLKEYKEDMKGSENYVKEITTTVKECRDLPTGAYTTTCMQCNYTCHDRCAYANDDEKKNCSAMSSSGYCEVCTNGCIWSVHKNTPFEYVSVSKKEKVTVKELLDRYKTAEKGKSQKEVALSGIKRDLIALYEGVSDAISEVKRCLDRLQDIALKPNPLSEVEYIDLLIDTEKREREERWEERVKHLEAVRENAQVLAGVKDQIKRGSTKGSEPPTDRSWWERFIGR